MNTIVRVLVLVREVLYEQVAVDVSVSTTVMVVLPNGQHPMQLHSIVGCC